MSFARFTNRQLSQKSEKKAAQLYGGRTQIASGALRHAKGDIKTDLFLIEDKITAKDSYSLRAALWRKIQLEAFNQQKMPMFRTTINGVTLCTLSETDLLMILNGATK